MSQSSEIPLQSRAASSSALPPLSLSLRRSSRPGPLPEARTPSFEAISLLDDETTRQTATPTPATGTPRSDAFDRSFAEAFGPSTPITALPPAIYTRGSLHERQRLANWEQWSSLGSAYASPLMSPDGLDRNASHPPSYRARYPLPGSSSNLLSPFPPATPSIMSPSAERSGFFDSVPRASGLTLERGPFTSGDQLLETTVKRPKSSRLRGAQRSVSGSIRRQVDPGFLKQLVNPKEVFLPVTTRKVALWSAYLGVIAGVVLLDHYFHVANHIGDGIRYNNFILMGFIYGTEPVLLLLLFTLGNYGPSSVAPAASLSLQQRYERAKTLDTALVIPAHNSDPESFRNMLQTAMRTFPAKNIFVVDNANSAAPVGDTQEVVRNVDESINYMWLPIGNKNAAQYVGTMAVRNAGLDYVLTVDDDVLVPETFISPKHLLRGDTQAASFPIQGVDSQDRRPLFVGWQDLEYKMSGFSKLAERRACGVLYPHGAVSFWERDTLLQALRKHDLVFFGEDLKLGFALMRMGKKLTIDDSQVFKTAVPETLLGAAPNYYQQRVRSWEMGRHILYKDLFRGLFSRNGQTTAHGFAVQKLMQSYAIAANMVDWLRVPMLVAMGGESHFWQKTAAFSAGPLIPALVYKYLICRKRPEMAPSLKTALTFPAYKMIYSTFSVIGAARSVYFYWPNKNKVLTVPQMEQRNDPRCIYLAPQFADDPGFLARGRVAEKVRVEQFMKTEDLSTELAMVPLNDDGMNQRRSELGDEEGGVAL